MTKITPLVVLAIGLITGAINSIMSSTLIPEPVSAVLVLAGAAWFIVDWFR